MKAIGILVMSLFLINAAVGQSADSSTTTTNHSGNNSFKRVYSEQGITAGNKKQMFVKGYVTIETHGLRLTPIENEISDLESSECNALLKRDTSSLKNIWIRDFTLDEPQNQLHLGKNSIPYYVSLNRTIEKLTILNNIVYTSGHEYAQQLKGNGKVDEPTKKAFFHMWIRNNGVWKLSTKK